jgi:hypothetical protein
MKVFFGNSEPILIDLSSPRITFGTSSAHNSFNWRLCLHERNTADGRRFPQPRAAGIRDHGTWSCRARSSIRGGDAFGRRSCPDETDSFEYIGRNLFGALVSQSADWGFQDAYQSPG